MSRYLEMVDGPMHVKKLNLVQLEELAAEIRHELITVLAKNGGHLGPNLGVVELTLALHYVFNTPKDKFVWDVSHQVYVHKLLTGRKERFPSIRSTGGLSGFAVRAESEHDCYGAAHAGTALSAALGMCAARDQRGAPSEQRAGEQEDRGNCQRARHSREEAKPDFTVTESPDDPADNEVQRHQTRHRGEPSHHGPDRCAAAEVPDQDLVQPETAA